MKGRLLVRQKDSGAWNSPDLDRVPESMLQAILTEDPDLIPLEDDRRPIVMVEEFAVSSGWADLVGVGLTGSITIGECKKADNPEIKRKVVGQLFAYAAAIWGMTYEAFDDVWQAKSRPGMVDDQTWKRRMRPPLADAMQKAAEDRGLPFDPTSFRSSVEETLRAGTFTLLLAVDEITDELERIIDYLSGHMSPGVDVIAIELGYLSYGNVEVLVPKTFGVEIAHQKAAGVSVPLAPDEPSFFEALRRSAGDWSEPMVRELLAWAAEDGLEVWYGEGAKYGTANVGLRDTAGKRRAIVAAWTSGFVEVELHLLKHLPPFQAHEARLDLLRDLEPIEGFARADKQADFWPQVKLDVLRQNGTSTEFLGFLQGVARRIREHQPISHETRSSQDEPR